MSTTTQILREPKAQRLRNNPMPQDIVEAEKLETVAILKGVRAERYAEKQKRKATPEEAQAFMNICYGCLEGLTDEEFEQMKRERILGK